MLSRRGVGTAAFGGMLGAALVGIFLIPVLYVVFQWGFGKRRRASRARRSRRWPSNSGRSRRLGSMGRRRLPFRSQSAAGIATGLTRRTQVQAAGEFDGRRVA